MSWIFIIIMSLFFYQSCGDNEDDCHKSITFVNTTVNALYVVSSSQYPDTSTFVGVPNPLLDPNFTKVFPNESNTQALWRRDCIELAFKDLISSDTLMIYVFDAQVLETTPWDTVKANYLVLKRFDLSLFDIKRMNWTITYP